MTSSEPMGLSREMLTKRKFLQGKSLLAERLQQLQALLMKNKLLKYQHRKLPRLIQAEQILNLSLYLSLV